MQEEKLRLMLETQDAFQKRLGYYVDKMTDEQLSGYIKEHTLHCMHELHEMLQELPYFKPWKTYKPENCSYSRCIKELIDAWHFFMNIMLALGIDANVLFSEYFIKLDENYQRQNTPGYKLYEEKQHET